jgi:hypothetical protein
MGVDPFAQRDFLVGVEVAAAALVAEALQPFDAASLIGPIPIANRVVVFLGFSMSRSYNRSGFSAVVS